MNKSADYFIGWRISQITMTCTTNGEESTVKQRQRGIDHVLPIAKDEL
jgi:hypothetical protein